MSKICELSGISVQFGNNVSHSQRKTRRRFLPNLQRVTFVSDLLRQKLRFRATPAAIRTVEVKGGIDSYLLSVSADKLSAQAAIFRKRLKLAKMVNA